MPEDEGTAPDTGPSSRGVGLMNIPVDSVKVLDAHEEIMELYMSSKHDVVSSGASSLGHLDSSRAVIEIDMVIRDPDTSSYRVGEVMPSSKGTPRQRRKAGRRDEAGGGPRKDVEISVKLQQNLNMLSRSSGDTGSILWRSSLYLAQHLLAQHYFPNPATIPLFDRHGLANANILELGCGTGLLPILLSPLCRSYTATDLRDNLDLCARNLDINGVRNVEIEEQDWIEVSESAKRRERIGAASVGPARTYDIILAIDCIYNEFLVKPFVDTLSHYCQSGSSTVVLVVVELRSSDVLVAFLEAWLAVGGWTIVRLPEVSLGLWHERPGNWVGWAGWRE